MRLIDADALVFSRVRIAHEDGTIGGYNAVVMSSVINNAPTIDAVPVRHGKWIPKMIKIGGCDYASGMKCSACGENALDAEGDEFLTDFCPNCGARMDEE